MRLTVIPSDNTMILDGRVLVFSFVSDPDLHAIQWYNTYGYVEKGGRQDKLEALADVQKYINAFNAEAAKRDAPPPPKTQVELDAIAAAGLVAAAKANLTKLSADIFPDTLTFLATLPGAPLSIKNAAILAAAEKAKVK